MAKIENKIALVAGGSRGLGKEMALCLAAYGADVILTYNENKAAAMDVVKQIQALGPRAAAISLDVSDPGHIDPFISELLKLNQQTFASARIDFLINNAGIGINIPFTETTEAQFDRLMNIQFKSPFFLSQTLLPHMNDGGGIVHISTGLTRFAYPGYIAYASMKSAMETLTRYMAKELGERGIRVNIVAPGAIETDFGGGTVRDNETVNKHIASLTALGRVGRPDDIGGVVAFLCSDDAKWINGQRLEVSGGQQL